MSFVRVSTSAAFNDLQAARVAIELLNWAARGVEKGTLIVGRQSCW